MGIELHQTIDFACPTGCRHKLSPVLLTLELTHEDEDTVQWDGACSSCGKEYHLIHTKEHQGFQGNL